MWCCGFSMWQLWQNCCFCPGSGPAIPMIKTKYSFWRASKCSNPSSKTFCGPSGIIACNWYCNKIRFSKPETIYRFIPSCKIYVLTLTSLKSASKILLQIQNFTIGISIISIVSVCTNFKFHSNDAVLIKTGSFPTNHSTEFTADDRSHLRKKKSRLY